jgi:hypothetical protein
VAAPGAATSERDRFDLEVEPVAPLDNALRLDPLKTDAAATVVLHPPVPSGSAVMTTRSLEGAADVFS